MERACASSSSPAEESDDFSSEMSVMLHVFWLPASCLVPAFPPKSMSSGFWGS